MNKIKKFICENMVGILLLILMIILVAITMYMTIHKEKNNKEKFMKACMKVEESQDICDYEFLKTIKHIDE